MKGLGLTCGSTHSFLQSPMQPDATDQAEPELHLRVMLFDYWFPLSLSTLVARAFVLARPPH